MADTTITALTSGSVPLDGDELAEIVQNGNSRKISVNRIADFAQTENGVPLQHKVANTNGWPILGANTSFDVDAAIGAAWENIGPTGSGATNTWTALDEVPSGATHIKVKIRFLVQNTSTLSNASTMTANLYAVKGGGTQTTTNTTKVAECFKYGSGNTNTSYFKTVERTIPIDSDRTFQMYYSVGNIDSSNIQMLLLGYEVNLG